MEVGGGIAEGEGDDDAEEGEGGASTGVILVLGDEGGDTHRSVLLNGLVTGGVLFLEDPPAFGVAFDVEGFDEAELEGAAALTAATGDGLEEVADAAFVTMDAVARFIAARAAFIRGADRSGLALRWAVEEEGVDLDEDWLEGVTVVEEVAHLCWVGKRCSAQNC